MTDMCVQLICIMSGSLSRKNSQTTNTVLAEGIVLEVTLKLYKASKTKGKNMYLNLI